MVSMCVILVLHGNSVFSALLSVSQKEVPLTHMSSISVFLGPEVPDPVEISLEYLSLCKLYPGVNLLHIQTHIRHFIEFSWWVFSSHLPSRSSDLYHSGFTVGD